LSDFIGGLAALRQRYPVLRRRRWLTGLADTRGQVDCQWWHPAGRTMDVADWHARELNVIGMWLGETFEDLAESSAAAFGSGISGANDASGELLCLFNRADEPQDVVLPAGEWRRLVDSAASQPFAEGIELAAGMPTRLAALSVQVLVRR
jgi:isoamylase